MIADEIQLWYVIQDKLQSETIFSPRQNSVWGKKSKKKIFLSEKKFVEKKSSQIYLGLTVTKVNCLGQINAYHHQAVYGYHNKT